MRDQRPTWWGIFELAPDSTGRWRIGPATLLVQRLTQEWRVIIETGGDPARADVDIEIPATLPAEQRDLVMRDQVRRFGVSASSGRVTLAAQLAALPVVAAPERPVEIPADDEITVYVGSTIWVSISVGEPSRQLLELPLMPVSDTWFGPSPRVGELCYASRTHCRLDLAALPMLPHRAITSVQVRNRASTPLILEQLKLPVPYLALYLSSEGGLWTQDVTLERSERDLSPLQVRQGVPKNAHDAVLVAQARKQLTDNVMVRAFSSLFSR